MAENTPNKHSSFKVLGIEFSGPAWLAVVFIVFCLIVFYIVSNPEIPSNNGVVAVIPVVENNNELSTQEDPCNVPWKQKPLSCKF